MSRMVGKGFGLTVLSAWICAVGFAPAAWSASSPAAVGLEAVGISPQVALRYGSNLDVRDALNRPVSAGLIERQVKEGQFQVAADASYTSRLPNVRAALEILERLVYQSLALLPGLPYLPHLEWRALPPTVRSSSRLRPAGLRASLAGLGAQASLQFSGVAVDLHPSFQRRDILRC